MSLMLSSLGMVRLGVVSPELRVADVDFNIGTIRRAVAEAASGGCRFLVFPELSVTGYTCGDLFYQSSLLAAARDGVQELAAAIPPGTVLILGLPVAQGGRLFNAAAVIAAGCVLGIVPKTFLPNTNEFYEERWFSSAAERTADHLEWGGVSVPFGPDLLFCAEEIPGFTVGVEICEDLWTIAPPSGEMAAAGATVLVNLSASPETLGKAGYRRSLVQGQSARCLAAYVYASAGPGESSTDLVFSGHSLIAEYGTILAETERFRSDTQMAMADVDIERLLNERHRNSSFAASRGGGAFRIVPFSLRDGLIDRLLRPVPATPFVPAREEDRAERCREIFALQTTGLATRLRHTGAKRAVLGISGGLDSTLALLVTAKAFDRLGLDRRGIAAITMPGFGTTARTRDNAERLADHLGVNLQIIPIEAAVRQHFRDIGQPEDRHDITFENAQARERTQILMDVANQVGGLVIGTGDLSELALGWCTYNADHMSMYAVNAGVPKTLVRDLVSWCAEAEFSGDASLTLADICATPFSPELLPPDENGAIAQITEEQVGPYVLHDFFLFHVVRLQFSPAKIFYLARQAFADCHGEQEILAWLKVFYRRFFAQQFKRSCLPDGPKVGSVALSPRGDWRMPSDASPALWLAQIEELETRRVCLDSK